jgi:rare lipoprotein A (peptidoglycan hydrolase)
MAEYLGIVDSGVTPVTLEVIVVQSSVRDCTTQVADKMGSMSPQPSKAMRSGALAPMGGEGTSGIVEAFDPHHSELNRVVSTKEVRGRAD